jgi:hypothetical protein
LTKVTALTQLASILEDNTSAIKAHIYPPESIQEMPAFVLEWTRGILGMATAGTLTNELCTALAVLYINRQVLPVASTAARPFIDEVRDALNGNASLNSTCVSVEEVRFEGPGAIDYTSSSGITNWHYGIRFEIDIRFKDNTTWAL